MGAKREPLERVAFVVSATVETCSQKVADITKIAVLSTAFLLRSAKDSKGETQ